MNRDPSHKAASNLEKWLKLNKKTQGQSAIPSMPPGESPLLSHGQERLWFLDRFNPGSVLYHYAHCYDIKGDFHCLVFKEALEILTKRHEILRTNFLEQDGAPILFVHEHRSIPLFEVDLSKLPGEIKARTLVEGTRDFILTPFDLATDVLIKFTLFKLDIKRYQLILVIHHIIGDRWSLNILHNEISTIYQALLAGREPTLQPLAIQYKDYAHWQRKKETDPNSLKFWSEKLDKDQMLPTLPYDQKKAVYTISGATHVLEWPSNISNELKEFAQAQGVTLYVLLLSIFHVLLYRYSRTDHILIGTPFSNRDKPILDHLIGFFNETLVIGAEITPQMSFLQMLRQVNQSVREAMMHRDVPFELLVNTLKPNRYAGENPLFNTMFLFNVEDQTSILDPELEIEHHAIDLEIAKFDLTLFISEKKDQLQLTWEYSQGLFSKERIKDISTHYQILTRAILADPTTAVKDLDLISEAEKDLILNKWNSSVNVQSPYTTILDLFAKHTEKNPDQVAVIYEGQRLTYEELDIWSNQLALQLLKSQVQSGDFVGVYTPRSLEMIVGILAVMKAGAAYLPLDPDYPADRIQYMMADASVNHVLYHPATVPDWANPAHRFLKISATKDDPAHPLEVQCKAQDIAYLIYTSGSSGKPKGVVVTHQNLMSSIWARHTFYDEKVRCFLLLSSFSFDSSVVGIFSSISSGGTLLIPPSRIEQDTEKLGRLISRFQVSHTLLLPTLYSVLLEYVNPQELSSLSNVILAGEACSSAVVKRHFEVLPGVNLYNEYGPTEATVWCIAHKILPDEAQDRVPIGKPIQNTQAYILDSHLRLVPPGIKGELYIAGVGVTPGYLNRPALTRERFLVNPFDDKSNATLYKTGDLAAYRGDGVIDFYGRVDNQVKIRGYRVELDEIKATVLSYPDVTDAIIQVQEAQGPTRQGNQQIAAHVIGKESTVDKLVIFLRERLPSYMVPRLIISHDTFPRLPNGKIDYSALADFIVDTKDSIDQDVALSKGEEILKDIWQETLRLKHVGIDDNFFEIGGDSILSIQIVAKARRENMQLGTDQIFRFQTIRDLARQLDQGESLPGFDRRKHHETVKSEAISLPLSKQQKAFFFHRLQEVNDQGFLQLEFEIEGDLKSELFVLAWERALELHPVMRTSFHWPTGEEAYQIIQPKCELSWEVKNWEDKTDADKHQSWNTYKVRDREKGLDLGNAPVSRMTIITWKENFNKFLWTCHHILLDGWSAGIILEDVLVLYDSLKTGEEKQLEEVPSYQDFLEWKSAQDTGAAQAFWRNLFANHSPASNWEKVRTRANVFDDSGFKLSQERTTQLKKLARESRITFGILLQGLWLIALSRVFQSLDLAFGITSSGRSGSFMGSHRMTGLYMNVLPARVIIDRDQKLEDWLGELQTLNMELRSFEYVDLDQIQEWIKPSPRLFSLFVFGNFLSEGLKIGDLHVQDYYGEFSSNHPITVRINPVSCTEVSLRSHRSFGVTSYMPACEEAYHNLLLDLSQESMQREIGSWLNEDTTKDLPSNLPELVEERALNSTYKEPENGMQLELIKIWEDVLDHKPIGVSDNFFALRGTSLLAIQMFSRIGDKFNKYVSPMALFEHPTISQLSSYLDAGNSAKPLEAIVPLKSSGRRPPLFCIHSGGAHVFFYKNLAKYIHDDQPLYAIRPKGLSDESPFHDTIENMASYYINQIRQVQPEGPYFLLGTCFSNAVGLEMCHQLTAMHQKVGTLIIVDSGPAHLQPPPQPGKRRPFRRMLSMIRKRNWHGIKKKFRDRFSRSVIRAIQPDQLEVDLKLKEMIDSLNNLYINYNWKPFAGQILLIRSSEFSARKDKLFHIDQWSALAEGRLEIEVVKGHHLTLFEEPEVKGLAQRISANLPSE